MNTAQSALREPTKPEMRLGWWFMKTFRPKEVAIRTARNELVAAAWVLTQRYDDWAALQTSQTGDLFRESRDRLASAFNAYNDAQDA